MLSRDVQFTRLGTSSFLKWYCGRGWNKTWWKTVGNHLCTLNSHLFAISVFLIVSQAGIVRHLSLKEWLQRFSFGFTNWRHLETSQVWVEGPDGTQLAEARGSVSTWAQLDTTGAWLRTMNRVNRRYVPRTLAVPSTSTGISVASNAFQAIHSQHR